MALLQQSTTIANANRRAKPLTVTRQSGASAGSSARSTFVDCKFNTEIYQFNGADVTLATITQAADRLTFSVNGAGDPSIGKYTGNTGADNEVVYVDAGTVGGLVDLVNGLNSGQFENGVPLRRWLARLRDYPPSTTLSSTAGQVLAAVTALRGDFSRGLPVTAAASTATTSPDYGANVAVGFGTGASNDNVGSGIALIPFGYRGGGSTLPDYLETSYAYPPPSTGYVVGRAGAIAADFAEFGRGSFVNRAPAYDRNYQKVLALFEVFIENLYCDVVFSTGNRMWRIFNILGELVWSQLAASATNVVTPQVLVAGPAFVVVSGAVGTAATITTNGNLTAKGTVRMA